MNGTNARYLVGCSECGRPVSAETAAMLGGDYWQHMAKEHGVNRSISVWHCSSKQSCFDRELRQTSRIVSSI